MPVPTQLIQDTAFALLTRGTVPLITINNTFVRDVPEFVQGDPSPSCIIVVRDDREGDRDNRTNTTICPDYPVLVLLVKKTALAPQADPWRKQARYYIRKELNRNFLLGGDGIIRRCRYNPSPSFDPATGFGIGFKVSSQLFVYRAEETRDP